MEIVGYGPSVPAPSVPKYTILKSGVVRLYDGTTSLDSENETYQDYVRLQGILEVPDDSWICVELDGSVVAVLGKEQELQWRAVNAEKCVGLVMRREVSDPIQAASLLSAAATLVGVSVPDLMTALREYKAKYPRDTTEQILSRIRRDRSPR